MDRVYLFPFRYPSHDPCLPPGADAADTSSSAMAKLTFKLIDLEDPDSYRSIFYGRSVWLQIVPGPGEPTWKQGSVLGARVHGPGMLPTVVVGAGDGAGVTVPGSCGGVC